MKPHRLYPKENVVEILAANSFRRAYKRLNPNQKAAVDGAVFAITADPGLGIGKKGDLAGVYVYKFPCAGKQFLLAYEFDPATRYLLLVGAHENFYRKLKR
ncbi:MAG: type II toxin-antitoxin system RelE/ParE family toxin [Nitrospinae bacterium]|nr:type II toxin-antitoxin system RelE/ParE family toxin [Nitrospinota bacterium]